MEPLAIGILGVTMNRRRFAILMIVSFTALMFLEWAVRWLENRWDSDGSPPRLPILADADVFPAERARLLPLADADAFPAERRPVVRLVADAVALSGERPEEFFAEVEAGRADGVVIFHLWHRSAWEPANRRVAGNPGGKCRDLWFDPTRGLVVKTLFWQ